MQEKSEFVPTPKEDHHRPSKSIDHSRQLLSQQSEILQLWENKLKQSNHISEKPNTNSINNSHIEDTTDRYNPILQQNKSHRYNNNQVIKNLITTDKTSQEPNNSIKDNSFTTKKNTIDNHICTSNSNKTKYINEMYGLKNDSIISALNYKKNKDLQQYQLPLKSNLVNQRKFGGSNDQKREVDNGDFFDGNFQLNNNHKQNEQICDKQGIQKSFVDGKIDQVAVNSQLEENLELKKRIANINDTKDKDDIQEQLKQKTSQLNKENTELKRMLLQQKKEANNSFYDLKKNHDTLIDSIEKRSKLLVSNQKSQYDSELSNFREENSKLKAKLKILMDKIYNQGIDDINSLFAMDKGDYYDSLKINKKRSLIHIINDSDKYPNQDQKSHNKSRSNLVQNQEVIDNSDNGSNYNLFGRLAVGAYDNLINNDSNDEHRRTSPGGCTKKKLSKNRNLEDTSLENRSNSLLGKKGRIESFHNKSKKSVHGSSQAASNQQKFPNNSSIELSKVDNISKSNSQFSAATTEENMFGEKSMFSGYGSCGAHHNFQANYQPNRQQNNCNSKRGTSCRVSYDLNENKKPEMTNGNDGLVNIQGLLFSDLPKTKKIKTMRNSKPIQDNNKHFVGNCNNLDHSNIKTKKRCIKTAAKNHKKTNKNYRKNSLCDIPANPQFNKHCLGHQNQLTSNNSYQQEKKCEKAAQNQLNIHKAVNNKNFQKK